MPDFHSISNFYCSATHDPTIQRFCNLTGHKLILQHAERGWLLRFASGRWSSPNFGSISELRNYCTGFLAGFLGGAL